MADELLTSQPPRPGPLAVLTKQKIIWAAISCVPQIIACITLLWALNSNHHRYGYYVLLRWICCAVFAYIATVAIAKEKQGWACVLGLTALVYNPIARFHLTKHTWSIINVITIGIAVASIFALRLKGSQRKQSATSREDPEPAPEAGENMASHLPAGSPFPFTAEHEKAIRFFKGDESIVPANTEEERVMAALVAAGLAKREGNLYFHVCTSSPITTRPAADQVAAPSSVPRGTSKETAPKALDFSRATVEQRRLATLRFLDGIIKQEKAVRFVNGQESIVPVSVDEERILVALVAAGLAMKEGNLFFNACTSPPETSSWDLDLQVATQLLRLRLKVLSEGRSSGLTLARATIGLPGEVLMRFVWCPPGSFSMGSDHKAAYSEEQPIHRVTLTKGFYMGIHPVTQAEWMAIMGTDPSGFKGPNRPVENVSWQDSVEFCREMTAHVEGKVTIRLPSEAEWEYACRAGATTEFNFGDVISTDLVNYDATIGWNGSREADSRNSTTDVGSFSPNQWGLFDMHGNVWEWCEDWLADYNAGDQTDPVQLEKGTDDCRVLRGGSWYYTPDYCRAASRYGREPSYRSKDVGFRVCFQKGGL